MPIIKAAELGEDLEDQPVPEGQYDLRVARATYKLSEGKGIPMNVLTFVIEGEPGAAPFMHWVLFPKEDDVRDVTRQRLRDIKRFFTVFGIPLDDYDPENDFEQLMGATGNCRVSVETGDDNVERNRLRLPRV